MAHVSGNPAWEQYPSAKTRVDAVDLENIEGVLDRHETEIAALEEGAGSGVDIKVGGAAPASGWWLDTGQDQPVTPATPTFTDAGGTAGDTYTIPTAAGVTYLVGGSPVSAGTYDGSGTVTVTAEAQTGYYIDGTSSWSHTFSAAVDPTHVTATGPTWTDDTVNGGGSWTTPTETGITYSPASGTATPSEQVTVTATAQSGYVIDGTTSWSHTFPADGPTAVLTYLQDAGDATGKTAYTFAGQNLGTASSDRSVIVVVGMRAQLPAPTVTVAGVAATLDHSSPEETDRAHIYRASVPTGTTGDVVVTFTGNASRCLIALYSLTGGTPVVAGVGAGTTGGTINVAGSVLAGSAKYDSGAPQTVSWVGATSQSFELVSPGVQLATATGTSTGSLSVGANFQGGTVPGYMRMAAVVYSVS